MEARLIAVDEEVCPRIFNLSPDSVVTLGRHNSNAIVLPNRHVSRVQAEIYAANGCWLIRNLGSNKTRVNGREIDRPAVLSPGDRINFNALRIDFVAELPADVPQRVGPPPEEPPPSDLSRTDLQADELSVLCDFVVSAAAAESSATAAVERAVAVLHQQTGASLTGFLSLDPQDPLPRYVLPAQTNVDGRLSRRLTRLAQERGQLVWLAREGEEPEGDSLLHVRDALCVPLRTNDHFLGAIHVYRFGRTFTEREARFCEVLAGYLVNSLRALRSRRTLEAENTRLRERAPDASNVIVGTSPPILRLTQDIDRLAPRDQPVLVTGESGVGKELVALRLHAKSNRCDGPLVTVNCAAIAKDMAESQLFGHKKGAFTGADKDHPGFFMLADEGTLFLDEIGDLPLQCQAKLLRAIEGKGFPPLGAAAEVYPDVRVIAATNCDLAGMVQVGLFRKDLFFRLGMQLRVPPLRDRPEDIPALVEHFLRRLTPEYRRTFRVTSDALARLQRYPWPGNVRQLRVVLQNAAAMCDGETIGAGDLRLDEVLPGGPAGEPPSLNLAELEEWAIREALRRTECVQLRAARLLGIHRETLAEKLRKYDIDRKHP